MNKFRRPSILEKVCYKLSSYSLNANKWGANLEKWGSMPICYRLTFVLLALSSQLSVFLKLCVMNVLLLFLLCQLCRSIRNASFPFQGLIKRSYHGWLSMMTSSDDPPFQPCVGPPSL